MNELDLINWMDKNMLSAITMKREKDGVRILKIWNYHSDDCKTITFDPRWDSSKIEDDEELPQTRKEMPRDCEIKGD